MPARPSGLTARIMSDPLVYAFARGTLDVDPQFSTVAAMLALLEAEDVAHGPLELLFTIDEESGLTGAAYGGKLRRFETRAARRESRALRWDPARSSFVF